MACVPKFIALSCRIAKNFHDDSANLTAATFSVAATTIHLASVAIAARRFRRGPRREQLSRPYPPVSLVRPLCGLDNYAADTLRSTFDLDYPRYEILFCVASANDPIVPLVESLMAKYAGANARLLVGDERASSIRNSIMCSRAGAPQHISGSSLPTATC